MSDHYWSHGGRALSAMYVQPVVSKPDTARQLWASFSKYADLKVTQTHVQSVPSSSDHDGPEPEVVQMFTSERLRE